MRRIATALALIMAVGAAPALAANARHPNQNVDRRVDRGGDTGDSRVEQLNQQQLDQVTAANRGSSPAPAMPAQPGIGAPLLPMGAAR